MSPPAASNDAILVADRLAVRFETAEGPVIAVDDVSFSVRPGEFLSIIGPSGCGKSTVFNVIGGLLGQHEGTVKVAGELIDGPHKSIGMVFQEESTFPWRNVTDNVAFPLELTGMAKAKRIERARHFIKMVGLDGFEKRFPGELSGGESARAGLALALANDPAVLLADEPTGEIDSAAETQILALLLSRAREGVAVLVASHSPAVSAAADRVIRLDDGKVLA